MSSLKLHSGTVSLDKDLVSASVSTVQTAKSCIHSQNVMFIPEMCFDRLGMTVLYNKIVQGFKLKHSDGKMQV